VLLVPVIVVLDSLHLNPDVFLKVVSEFLTFHDPCSPRFFLSLLPLFLLVSVYFLLLRYYILVYLVGLLLD